MNYELFLQPMSYPLFSLPSALCPLRYDELSAMSFFPLPSALCALRPALCPLPSAPCSLRHALCPLRYAHNFRLLLFKANQDTQFWVGEGK